jgi:precorrin-3B synthase
MEAKDGFLVRLRISGGIISAATMRVIAQAGRDYGNGFFDLSVRANLQMRGARENWLPHLIETLDSLGLVDEAAAAEAVRNVLLSPLTGLDGQGEASAATKALEAMLTAKQDLHALPAKFGFLIDDGSGLSLANVEADVRFDWTGGNKPFAIGIGGRAGEADSLGFCEASEIPDIAARIARAFLQLGSSLADPPRRMRGLIETCGASAIAGLCGLRVHPPRWHGIAREPSPIGLLRFNSVWCFCVGVPFGHLDSNMLDAAAAAADMFGNGEIRLTPWRALILPFVRAEEVDAIRTYLAAHRFIVDREDPRLAVSACRGSSTCERGTIESRSDALALMYAARRLCKSGVALHVSGCIKGCGRQTDTPLTLIADAGLYDLIADETALCGSIVSENRLTLAEVRQRLESLSNLGRQ